jgi:hypothetical protein
LQGDAIETLQSPRATAAQLGNQLQAGLLSEAVDRCTKDRDFRDGAQALAQADSVPAECTAKVSELRDMWHAAQTYAFVQCSSLCNKQALS